MLLSGAWLVLDDTSWQRYAKQAEAVSWVWSSTTAKVCRASQVVLLSWTDGKRKVPLSCQLWEKGKKSKVELACELLRQAKERGIEPNYVLFDSWHTARQILNLLGELEWKYVARIKSNRLLDGERLNQRWQQRFGQAQGKLKRVNEEVKVIKDGKKYWVTNDQPLEAAQLKQQYRRRQQIEETFRVLKQEFGWGSCRARKVKAQKAHLHLGLMALCLTQQAAESKGQTIYAFKQGVKWRVMATNPAQFADKPKQVRREMQFLAPEQAAAFIEAAKGDLYFVYFALALDTGARPSELLALQWKDIDFEQGHISIQRSLEYPDYSNEFQFVEPKTARSRRSIKISKQNLIHLREHRKAQGVIRLKKGAAWQAYDLVFATRDGKPTQARNILRRHLRPILKAAELPQTLNLYSLRHSCATLLLSAGVNPKIVSERLGHASIVLTLDTYSHVLPNMQQSAADELEKILFGEFGTLLAHQKGKAAFQPPVSC
jgi:integrase